jgi:hypothetical protein
MGVREHSRSRTDVGRPPAGSRRATNGCGPVPSVPRANEGAVADPFASVKNVAAQFTESGKARRDSP